VGAVTRADVVDFLDRLERGEGLRHQVNRCRETLRAIFAYAIERELVAVNPIVGVSKRKVETPRDRTLTADEWQSRNFPSCPEPTSELWC
jgi:site-specific recombinase XerD